MLAAKNGNLGPIYGGRVLAGLGVGGELHEKLSFPTQTDGRRVFYDRTNLHIRARTSSDSWEIGRSVRAGLASKCIRH